MASRDLLHLITGGSEIPCLVQNKPAHVTLLAFIFLTVDIMLFALRRKRFERFQHHMFGISQRRHKAVSNKRSVAPSVRFMLLMGILIYTILIGVWLAHLLTSIDALVQLRRSSWQISLSGFSFGFAVYATLNLSIKTLFGAAYSTSTALLDATVGTTVLFVFTELYVNAHAACSW